VWRRSLRGYSLSSYDLWSRIVGTPTAGSQKIAIGHHIGQAKVGYFDIVLPIEENILWFEVAKEIARRSVTRKFEGRASVGIKVER
jgi:hypothetical protein